MTRQTSMKDGEETNEEYLDAMNVTGRKIVSEDEGDEDFDLDAAFNEKFSKSKERDEEEPLPEGTIRVKAKTSSTSSTSSSSSSSHLNDFFNRSTKPTTGRSRTRFLKIISMLMGRRSRCPI